MKNIILSVFIVNIFLPLKALAFNFDYVHIITEQEIQSHVAEFMPLEKTQYMVTLTVSDPTIDLIKETDEIAVHATINTRTVGDLTGQGDVMIQGALKYEPKQGAFYLHNIKIGHLAIKNFPEFLMPEVKKIAQLVLSQALLTYPVYTLTDDDEQQKFAKAMLKSVEVKNEALHLTLGL